jgi:arylsulfatase A-like enzyme
MRTPNLDALAASGARFACAYTDNPLRSNRAFPQKFGDYGWT